MTRLAGLMTVLAMVSACSGSTSPSTPAPVQVTILSLPGPSGTDARAFGMQVKNISLAPVDLSFPSSCQLVPHILDGSGREVTPQGGGQACAAVITHLSLVAGESLVLPAIVAAGNAPVPGRIVVPAGDYMIYTSLEDDKYRLKSDRVQFTVR
jgi:hypothetical protein